MEEYSDTYLEGYVIESDPKKGEELKDGDVVTLTVSRGPEIKEVSVPDVEGDDVESARSALSQRNLQANVTERESDRPAGEVLEQSPKGGTTAEEGSTVDLVVSSGPAEEPQQVEKIFTILLTPDLNDPDSPIQVVVTVDGQKQYDQQHTLDEGEIESQADRHRRGEPHHPSDAKRCEHHNRDGDILMGQTIEAVILRGIGGFYYIAYQGQEVECRAGGRLRLRRDFRPAVGDVAQVELRGEEGLITDILPRRNFLMRPPVANIDQLFIVASEADPVTDLYLIDKVSVIALRQNIQPILVLNKWDLKESLVFEQIYRGAGFPVVRASAQTGLGSRRTPPDDRWKGICLYRKFGHREIQLAQPAGGQGAHGDRFHQPHQPGPAHHTAGGAVFPVRRLPGGYAGFFQL